MRSSRWSPADFCWRGDRLPTPVFLGFPCDSASKKFAYNERDLGSILGWEYFPGEGIGYSLQYSDLENSMDCRVRCAAKSQTRVSDFPFQVGSNSVWLVSLYRGELWRRHTHVDGTILRTTRSQERGLQWIFSSQPSVGSPQASHFTFLSLFP